MSYLEQTKRLSKGQYAFVDETCSCSVCWNCSIYFACYLLRRGARRLRFLMSYALSFTTDTSLKFNFIDTVAAAENKELRIQRTYRSLSQIDGKLAQETLNIGGKARHHKELAATNIQRSFRGMKGRKVGSVK